MENKCANCHGDGIVGQGEQPWLKQGHTETCKVCNGTGKAEADAGETVDTTESQATEPETPAQAAGEEKKEEDADTAPEASDPSIPGAVDENLPASDIEPAVDEDHAAADSEQKTQE